jgi:HEAT repeat protein
MANDPKSPFDYREPLYTLAYIGDAGFQPVLDVLKNVSHPDRGAAALIIGATATWGINRLRAAPVLIECLHSKDGQLVDCAVTALGRIGLKPDLVVPELAERLNDPRANARSAALRSLGRFGADSRSALPLLEPKLRDANEGVREAATNAMQKIAPEVLTNGMKGSF